MQIFFVIVTVLKCEKIVIVVLRLSVFRLYARKCVHFSGVFYKEVRKGKDRYV